MTSNPAVATCIPSGRSTLAAVFVLLAAAAHAQPTGSVEMPIEALKTVYLNCERTAVGGGQETSEIMRCSVVYEELKRRAFDGDFRRLKAWTDTALAAPLDS